MTNPNGQQPISEESVDPGPDIDENVNGGDPDPTLELDPDREDSA